MKMMAPTRWTLFFSATAALWCCYSITIAAAAASTPTTFKLNLAQFKELAARGGKDLVALVKEMYVIDLNKDGNIGAELERAARSWSGPGRACGYGRFWVQRPELVEASAIVLLKEGRDPIQISMIVKALKIAERNSLEVGDVGGGWFGPVGVRYRSLRSSVHYAVYLFQLPVFGAFQSRHVPEPPVFGAFPVRLRLPFIVDVGDVPAAAGSTENVQRRSAPYLSPVPSPAEVDEAGTSASPPGAVEAGARLQDGWDAERQALEAKIAAMLSDHSDAEQNIRQEFQVERERIRHALEETWAREKEAWAREKEAWAREKEAWAREKADLEKACEEQTKKAENFNKQLKAMREHRALSSEEEDVEMGDASAGSTCCPRPPRRTYADAVRGLQGEPPIMGDASEQGLPNPNSLRPVGFERSTSSAGPGPTSRGGEVGGQQMLEEAETTVGGTAGTFGEGRLHGTFLQV